MNYILPIDRSKLLRASRTESETHSIYKYSVDLFVPIGTEVFAAADGIVLDVKSDSNEGGYAKSYEDKENFIEIRHGNEYSSYCHLKQGGVTVKIGDVVKAGDLIGYSGATGWLANCPEPHLHFMVGIYHMENIDFKFEVPNNDL